MDNNKLFALLETTRILNSSNDLKYILDYLLEESLKQIPAGDAAIIFLYNEEMDYLEVKAYTGYDSTVEKVKIKPGESTTGQTFQDKKSFFLTNLEEVSDTTSTMSQDNRESIEYIFSTMFPKISSSISCPLNFLDKCLGVIVVDSFNPHLPLSTDDLNFLSTISVQASVAINNSIIQEKQKLQQIKLEESNRIIKKNNEIQNFIIEIHDNFTNMVLDSNSFYNITHKLSKIIEEDIILYSHIFNLRISTVTNPSIRSIIRNYEPTILKRLNTGDFTPIHMPEISRYFLMFPIIAKEDLLGCNFVISSSSELPQRRVLAIEQANTVLSIELLNEFEKKQLELNFKGDFLDNLLINENMENLKRFSENFNYKIDKDHRIILMDVTDSEMNRSKKFTVNFLDYISQELNIKLLEFFPNTITFIRNNYIVFIIEYNKVTTKNFSEGLIRQLFDSKDESLYMYSQNVSYTIGVSNIFSANNSFKESFVNAQIALDIGKKKNINEQINFFDNLQIKKLLLNTPQSELKKFVDSTLGPLINSKKSSDNDFFVTLETYVKSGYNWSESKDILHIHGNTLTYRVKRIQTILGLNLSDYHDRLKVELALEILDLI
ncbi:MAG: helix-turn-helix domain-containing protein [Firmicutes bacterium]|nr:helix-turn-helix domain-containing protein [Bacillota bacterium]